jgi:uncharacterized protein
VGRGCGVDTSLANRVSYTDAMRATVSVIHRFPVKSMAGESVHTTELDRLGIAGDRRWALRDATSGKIISAKQPSVGRALLGCSARLVDVSTTAHSPDVIITVDGEDLTSMDRSAVDQRLTELLGRPVSLVSAGTSSEVYESYWPSIDDDLALNDVTIDLAIAGGAAARTFVDLAPLHILTTTSLARLQRLAPDSLIDVARFRPGLLLDLDEAVDDFVENGWADRQVQLGSAVLRFGAASPRCVMTTLAQPGLPDDKSVLQTLATHNRRDFGGFGNFACLGVYAEVVEPGTVTVGDFVDLG